ncbi:MAG: TraR/DksA C4-type zinc finger protein [Candidatus Peribacteraceae bacterium]|jgi:DnaK suppressor protein|nr:hypothetical protein [bacterium]MDP6561610.1 TraR/DksA C4-type zinc finger protein [Candidatus Peribacteraceae bacterium]|tara:strand:+ start:2636 stop:3076 length:441 start_codon:yes stop_codon:yes gene_type:complete
MKKGVQSNFRDALHSSAVRHNNNLTGVQERLSAPKGGGDAFRAEVLEIEPGLLEVQSKLLDAERNALSLIEEGRYGICDTCTKKIPPTRLKAVPTATECIKCARTSQGENGFAEVNRENNWGAATDSETANEVDEDELRLIEAEGE